MFGCFNVCNVWHWPKYEKKCFQYFKDYTYDAYKEDIAILQVYFKTSSVMEYETYPSQTWIDFFSIIGGLLGLCIGLSIVTVIELFWLLLRIGAKVVSPFQRKGRKQKTMQ